MEASAYILSLIEELDGTFKNNASREGDYGHYMEIYKEVPSLNIGWNQPVTNIYNPNMVVHTYKPWNEDTIDGLYGNIVRVELK